MIYGGKVPSSTLITNTVFPSILNEDDFYGDEEGAPDNVGALPSPDLLDNLALRQP